MRLLNSSLLLLSAVVLVSGCVRRVPASSAPDAPLVPPAPVVAEAPAAPVEVPAGSTPARPAAVIEDEPLLPGDPTERSAEFGAADGSDAEGETEEDGPPAADEGSEEETTATADAQPAADGPLYTADLSDEVLAAKWKDALESLGSISVGFVHQGRLINGQQFPQDAEGGAWKVVSPLNAWATQETIDYVTAAIRKVKAQFPNAPPLRVNQISAREGGYLRPHKSHQNGRDVDLGFYYPTAEPIRVRERERYIDVALNWALVKALVTETDVQMILVDRRIIKVLYKHAVEIGEDKAWLDSVFHAGANSLIRHARRHRDHFHVRFYNPRAQELGRRVTPLLAQRPEQNIVMHRVRRGDTLGAIAVRYGTTVKLLQRKNRLRGSFLRVGQVLKVQLRGPCTRCPVPPPVIVPPRRLPPSPMVAGLSQAPR